MSRLKTVFYLFQIVLFTGCSQGVTYYSDVDHPKYNSTVTGTISKPEGEGPFPAVVLMHGCSGLNRVVRQGLNAHSSYLTSNGFVTFIIDSFKRRGKGDQCRNGTALQEAQTYRQFDAFHGLKYLQSLPYVDRNNIFLVGQSNGGTVALLAAKFGADDYVFPDKPLFRGIVAFYPVCLHLSSVSELEILSPLLVLAGRDDDWTPPLWCILAKEHVTGADYEVIVYENAHHSFDLLMPVHSFAGHTVGGNSEARSDSRVQMLNWFLQHMQ